MYEECTNRNTAYPLIKQEFTGPSKIYYSVLDDKQTGARIAISNISDPFLHNIFTKRNITEYQGMISKDPEILQFWGTNFRRTLCDPNYWVKLTMKKANTLALNMDRGVIIIPDTRFINEAEAVTINKGFYVRVVRIKEDGSQYIADDRDPNHPSEAELEGYPASSTLTAKNIPELQIQVHNF